MRPAEADVFDERDDGNLRLTCGRVGDEPRMVFIFTNVFAEADRVALLQVRNAMSAAQENAQGFC